jgi:subtilisin-like proprotein convertase family protein
MVSRNLTRVLALLLLTSLVLPLAEVGQLGSALAKSKTKTVTKTFSNLAPIPIPGTGDEGPANPYPSTIQVSGLKQGKIQDINVHLNNLSHTFPDDIDMLLAATQIPGINSIIMSDVGGDIDAVNVNLVLDDTAPTALPADGPLVSGSFQPTNIGGNDAFDPPAPAPSGLTSFAFFSGKNPNGTWQLFIQDDGSPDTGTLAGGWSIEITAQVKVKDKKHKKH